MTIISCGDDIRAEKGKSFGFFSRLGQYVWYVQGFCAAAQLRGRLTRPIWYVFKHRDCVRPEWQGRFVSERSVQPRPVLREYAQNRWNQKLTHPRHVTTKWHAV
jgi:hypothetical protein